MNIMVISVTFIQVLCEKFPQRFFNKYQKHGISFFDPTGVEPAMTLLPLIHI